MLLIQVCCNRTPPPASRAAASSALDRVELKPQPSPGGSLKRQHGPLAQEPHALTLPDRGSLLPSTLPSSPQGSRPASLWTRYLRLLREENLMLSGVHHLLQPCCSRPGLPAQSGTSHTHIHTHRHAHTYTRAHTPIHTNIHKHANIYNRDTRTHMGTYVHTHQIRMYVHSLMHINIYTHVCTYTCMHTQHQKTPQVLLGVLLPLQDPHTLSHPRKLLQVLPRSQLPPDWFSQPHLPAPTAASGAPLALEHNCF